MKRITIFFFSIFLIIGSFAQKVSIEKCKIWKPASFCTIPDSLKSTGAFCMDCTWREKTCKQIDKKKGLVGIWITFTSESDTSFQLKNNFSNVSVIKKNSQKAIRPYALLNWGEYYSHHRMNFGYQYMTYLRSKNYFLTFKSKAKVDVIFIFRGVEKGDKIIINNFLQAEITE
jgi:hypothetical protein